MFSYICASSFYSDIFVSVLLDTIPVSVAFAVLPQIWYVIRFKIGNLTFTSSYIPENELLILVRYGCTLCYSVLLALDN